MMKNNELIEMVTNVGQVLAENKTEGTCFYCNETGIMDECRISVRPEKRGRHYEKSEKGADITKSHSLPFSFLDTSLPLVYHGPFTIHNKCADKLRAYLRIKNVE